jgi:hypothetical protein
VLKRAYRYDKSIILAVLKQLLGGSEVYISSHAEAPVRKVGQSCQVIINSV